MSRFGRNVFDIVGRLGEIIKLLHEAKAERKLIMTVLDDIKAGQAVEKQEIDALIAALQDGTTAIADLTQKLNDLIAAGNGAISATDAQAILDEINAENAKMAAVLPPPPPAPPAGS